MTTPRELAERAFEKALYAAWAASWAAYVVAGHADAGEPVRVAVDRAKNAMDDARDALSAVGGQNNWYEVL